MNKKRKAKLKSLVKEKAVREYFIEKMRQRLSIGWKAKRTKTKMHKETKKRYKQFNRQIDLIEGEIIRIVPPNTHYKELQFKITD